MTTLAPSAASPWLDPITGRPLRSDGPWSLTDGATRWPVIEGIPYLRRGRDDLRRSALDTLDAGDARAALVILLADRDDYATGLPPDPGTLGHLVEAVDSGRATLREAMAALNFGPVADYFAHRWSAPTYLSGLALLDRHRPDGASVLDLACGIGHYLRDLAARGVPCLGLDVVFSKLWLARRFLVDRVPLVCGDAVTGLPIGPIKGPTVVFCHDAFYFLPEKPRLVVALRRLVGEDGVILIGHAHNRDFDHRGVAGEPWTPAEYAALLPGCRLFDDAELARSAWSESEAPAREPADLAEVEAVALAWSPAGPKGRSPAEGTLTIPPIGSKLRLNPMLDDDEGTLRPRWPSARFEAEYAGDAPYLVGEPPPGPELIHAASLGERNAEIIRLARRRILLDLPGRW